MSVTLPTDLKALYKFYREIDIECKAAKLAFELRCATYPFTGNDLVLWETLTWLEALRGEASAALMTNYRS
jgi:hypothetical protein